MAFLLDGDDACARHLEDDPAVGRARRLAIYANAYRMRLREAIATDHPGLGAYLGDDLFDRMVEGYIRTCPSRARSLRHFAAALPDYLAVTPPFDDHPEIAELAEFERLMLDAFDAPDAPRRSVDDLARLPSDAWPAMRLHLHPSCRLFRPAWNAVEIWKAIKDGAPPPDSDRATHAWVIWRGTDRLTHFAPVEAAGLYMLQALGEGADLASVCEGMLRWHDEPDVGAAVLGHLAGWLEQGLVTDLPAPS
jgi:hypothetical protein